jgi:hypothetical protein
VAFISLHDASPRERLQIRHDILDLTRLKPEPRHHRMDPLGQGPLQIRHGILEMQRAERGRDRDRALADFVDGMTLRAMQANKSQTSSFRRRLCQSGFACAQQNCGQSDDAPSELRGIIWWHSSCFGFAGAGAPLAAHV